MLRRYTETDRYIRQEDWNTVIDLVQKGATARTAGAARLTVINNTGGQIGVHSVLTLEGSAAFSDRDEMLKLALNGGIPLRGHTPSAGEVAVVTCDGARAGAVVECVVLGIVPAAVEVMDTSHRYADVNPGSIASFRSVASGPVRLLGEIADGQTMWYGNVMLTSGAPSTPVLEKLEEDEEVFSVDDSELSPGHSWTIPKDTVVQRMGSVITQAFIPELGGRPQEDVVTVTHGTAVPIFITAGSTAYQSIEGIVEAYPAHNVPAGTRLTRDTPVVLRYSPAEGCWFFFIVRAGGGTTASWNYGGRWYNGGETSDGYPALPAAGTHFAADCSGTWAAVINNTPAMQSIGKDYVWLEAWFSPVDGDATLKYICYQWDWASQKVTDPVPVMVRTRDLGDMLPATVGLEWGTTDVPVWGPVGTVGGEPAYAYEYTAGTPTLWYEDGAWRYGNASTTANIPGVSWGGSAVFTDTYGNATTLYKSSGSVETHNFPIEKGGWSLSAGGSTYTADEVLEDGLVASVSVTMTARVAWVYARSFTLRDVRRADEAYTLRLGHSENLYDVYYEGSFADGTAVLDPVFPTYEPVSWPSIYDYLMRGDQSEYLIAYADGVYYLQEHFVDHAQGRFVIADQTPWDADVTFTNPGGGTFTVQTYNLRLDSYRTGLSVAEVDGVLCYTLATGAYAPVEGCPLSTAMSAEYVPDENLNQPITMTLSYTEEYFTSNCVIPVASAVVEVL